MIGHSFRSEMLPQSPGLRSPMALTPTPPWVTSGDVAELGNAAVELTTEKPISSDEAETVPKKIKRIRLQLDARIELTDEELKVHSFPCFVHGVYGSLCTRQRGCDTPKVRKSSAGQSRTRSSRRRVLILFLKCYTVPRKFVSSKTRISAHSY